MFEISAPRLVQQGFLPRWWQGLRGVWLEVFVGSFLAQCVAWVLQPTTVHGHPAFWLVLVFAARYGYGPGIVCGAIAALVTLWTHEGLVWVLSVRLDRSALLDAITYPLVGIVVGFLSDLPRVEAKQAREQARKEHDRAENLAARYKVMRQVKLGLDRLIVGQTETVVSVYEATREMETLDPDLVPKALAALLARVLGAEAAAVYLGEGRQIPLVAHVGVHPARLEQAAFVDLLEAASETALPGSDARWLLVAILRHSDGRPRGALVIERISFLRLNIGTRQMMDLLAQWGSEALNRAEAHQAALEARRDHPVTGLMRDTFTLERAESELRLAKRYDLALTVMLVRDPLLASLEGEPWCARAAEVAGVLKAQLRTIDLAGHLASKGDFLLILPLTPQTGAVVVQERLEKKLAGAWIASGSFMKGEPPLQAMLAHLNEALSNNV